MEIENRLREDLWKAIQAHYERADYTEAVRDCMYHICDVLREKSGLQDKDGTKLVESALLGNNPAIHINKNESTTEKDVQQGVGFAFKGLMQAIRNPLSHEKEAVFSKEEAEAIILYSNLLLNYVDRSGGTTRIDDITELLLDEDFTGTKEYAELLLKEVPNKKRYDLMLHLFQMRDKLPQNQLKYFIAALGNSLTKAAKADFVNVVSNSMLKCKDNLQLRMYCHYFMEDTFSSIHKLAQLRIEDFAMKSIQEGEVNIRLDPHTMEEKETCNSVGTLGTWFSSHLDQMSNKDAIITTLFRKTEREPSQEEYVFKYYSSAIESAIENRSLTDEQIKIIKRRLNKGDKLFYDALFFTMMLDDDEEYKHLFADDYHKCEAIINATNDEGATAES